VIEPTLGASLVPAIGRSSLLAPRLATAPLRTVPVATVAAAAKIEDGAARLIATQSLADKDLLGSRHRP